MLNLHQLFEEQEKTHVMTFMRANPITVGHEKVVNQVTDLAKNLDATHQVVLSHSHDGQKNPLTPEQKLKHAKRAFPGVNVSTSSEKSPNLLFNAADAYKKGVKHLHLVVGQDRVKGFNDLLHKYNGVDTGKEGHGLFNFKSITVHSAGDRDPDAEGVEGISATKMRQAAQMGNRDLFHAGAPSKMAPEHREEMMNDVAKGIVPVAPKKQSAKTKQSPGTPVLIQHGSSSQTKIKKKLKESFKLHFGQLTEKKFSIPYQEMLHDDNYTDARDATVSHLNNANDKIAKGGPDNVENTLFDHYYKKNKNPHTEHLSQYASGSWQLNNDLFDHHKETGTTDPEDMPWTQDHDYIKSLDNALNHSKTKKPMTVFSGVGFNPGKLADEHPEKKLFMPAYTSSSIDPQIAAKFAKPLIKGSSGEDTSHLYDPGKDEKGQGADHHILKINVPKGHNGFYMAGHSEYPEEKEFLLPRNQTMKIDPNPEIHEFHDGNVKHRMHIWNATPTPTKMPKPVAEETVAGGEMVRGLGDVSGNPAVNNDPLAQYISTNALAKDEQNGALMKIMKDSQLKYNVLGFKSFDPKSKGKK